MSRQHIQEEWEIFLHNARRFDDEVPERRYGVINPSAKSPFTIEDMLYADCPIKLHNLHYDNWPPIVLRTFLDRLEVAEGKKPSGYSSLNYQL